MSKIKVHDGKPISAEDLRERLQYDADGGQFYWRRNRGPHERAGKKAGSPMTHGYIQIMINGRNYTAHRLAWLYEYGEFPEGMIDHVNRDRTDNRIANLRTATGTQNLANARRSSTNTSGFKGVSYCRRTGKYEAYVHINGKKKYLGMYVTAEEAHATYIKNARESYGEFAYAG